MSFRDVYLKTASYVGRYLPTVKLVGSSMFASLAFLTYAARLYLAIVCPRVSDEATGHIYQANIHGIVYLTHAQDQLMNLPWLFMGFAAVIWIGSDVVVAIIMMLIAVKPRE